MDNGVAVYHEKTSDICTYKDFAGPGTWISDASIWMPIQGTDVAETDGLREFPTTTAELVDEAQPTDTPPDDATDVSAPETGYAGIGDSCAIKYQKVEVDGGTIWAQVDKELAVAMCMDYCKPFVEPGKIAASTCFGNGEYSDTQGKGMTDDQPVGHYVWGVGNCLCSDPFVGRIIEEFVEKGLPAIGEIACKTWFTAINTVIQVGISMIPGVGGVVAGMINFAAQAAEMIAYAYPDPEQQKAELAKHLNNPNYRPDANVMDTVCGNDYTPADAEAIFNTFQFVGVGGFTKAPKFLKEWPSFGRGAATPKQVDDSIAALRKRDDGPDAPTDRPDTPNTPNNDRPNNGRPNNDRQDNDRDGKSCRRARNGKRGGDRGKQDNDCDSNDVTIYSVETWLPGETTTITTTCPRYDTQACAHYYSAISSAGRSSVFTCTSSFKIDARDDSPAVRKWKTDHTDQVWRAFTASEHDFPKPGPRGGVDEPSCEVDEWPPNYFLTKAQLDQGTNNDKGQLVRWVPGRANRDAGQLWAGFCKDHDGDKGNGERKKMPPKKQLREGAAEVSETLMFNGDLVSTIGAARSKVGPQDKNNGNRRTTTSIWESAKFTRAVFALTFDFEVVPNDQNTWLLTENECWPSAIASADPGYVLAKNDPFYDKYPAARDFKDANDYAQRPSQDLIHAAEKLRPDVKLPGKRQGSPGTGNAGGRSKQGKGGGSGTRRRDVNEVLEILDGELIARDLDLNTTRPLTERELLDEIEVRECADRMCTRERREAVMEGEQDEVVAELVVPGVLPPSVPANNDAAEPTPAGKVIMPRGGAVLERSPATLRMPAATVT